MALFHPVRESEVAKAIASSFLHQFEEYVVSDVIIVGGGPSGLIAGKELAEAGLKTVIIERNNYLGGGFWAGGYFMNKVTLRAPSQAVLDELGVPYEQASEGLYVADAPHACSRLIAASCDAGAKFFNLTLVEDLVVKENNRVAGVVINWSPVTHLPKEVAAWWQQREQSSIEQDDHGTWRVRGPASQRAAPAKVNVHDGQLRIQRLAGHSRSSMPSGPAHCSRSG